jgi:putative lipoprotein (rSAM/lipoprotein system)
MAIKKRFFRVFNVFLAALLSILGFGACDRMGAVEYGVPNADYTIKGTVLNKADSKPIKGIRVGFSRVYPEPVLMYGVMPYPYRSHKADTTQLNGAYKLTDNFTVLQYDNNRLEVFVQDIDGPANGAFNDTIITVDFSNVKATGKPSNWYEGEYSVELNIKLEEKKEGNE